MRLNRFYSERENLREGSSVKLPDSDVNHIRKVLRMKKGDKILIFNGEKEFLAELDIVSNEFITARLTKLLKKEDFSGENKVEVVLIQGLLRAGKIDLIIEKTTELGIDAILPVECEYSQTKAEKLEGKIDRWQRIAVAASKQSERIRVPEIFEPIALDDLEEILKQFDKVYLFTIPRNQDLQVKELPKESTMKTGKIAYIIGPEGGFSPKEHELFKTWNIDFYKLSEHILRSETAAITGAALVRFIHS